MELLTGFGILSIARERAQAILSIVFLDDRLSWLRHGHGHSHGSSLHGHSGLSHLHLIGYTHRMNDFVRIAILTGTIFAIQSIFGIKALHVVVQLLLTGLL